MVKEWEEGMKLDLFEKYYRNKYHNNINDTCEGECRAEIIDSIQTAAKQRISLEAIPKL